MWKDFKAFLMRGNVIDLATAVVIGAAFGKIVTALVDHIIMPCIGMLTAGVDFANMKYVLQEAEMRYLDADLIGGVHDSRAFRNRDLLAVYRYVYHFSSLPPLNLP